MEEEVGKVVASMDVITEKSESINVALAPHRSKVPCLIEQDGAFASLILPYLYSLCLWQLKVEKLIGVRRLLKRLEFIFDLPQRLNTCVFKLVVLF